MAFPTTGILDDFNRANEGPPPSSSWVTGGWSTATSSLLVVSNALADDVTNNGGWWGTQYGPDTEVYGTWSTLPGNGERIEYLLRGASISTAGVDGYKVRVVRVNANPGANVLIYRTDDAVNTQLGATFNDTAGALAGGVKFGADVVGSDITGYVNRSGTWSSEVTRTDATYNNTGYIGLLISDNVARFDDFGGGTIAAADTGLAWITA